MIDREFVCRSDYWPPGALMRYDCPPLAPGFGRFTTVGVVVSNDSKRVTVVWDKSARDRVKTYDISSLNPIVISRVHHT